MGDGAARIIIIKGGVSLNKKHKERIILVMILAAMLASCAPSAYGENPSAQQAPLPQDAMQADDTAAVDQITQSQPAPRVLREDRSYIFVERNTNAADGGVERLVDRMYYQGLPLHRTANAPHGLIAADDVVLFKINCQWAERGGTNTDVIRGFAQAVAAHPDGFVGEIIIADNGQGQFGTYGTGGSLDWSRPNSLYGDQSTMDVINALREEGIRISGYLWDDIAMVRVSEFYDGDFTDGFVVGSDIFPTGLEISYPKFTTVYGTNVSFKNGIWDSVAGDFNSEQLRIINMPVLKSHFIFQQTGAVKNYMGIVANRLTQFRSHNSVGTGGMGTLMAETRMPVLNVMDMIWTGAGLGPGSTNDSAVETRAIAVSTDAFALDYWATREFLLPHLSGQQAALADPLSSDPDSFGHWLRLSANEVEARGLRAELDSDRIMLIE